MKGRFFLSMAILLALGGGWIGYAAYRAHRNLVTLDVRNADLRAVVRRIEWQTWEKIIVHQDVDGKISMCVRDAPLARVMGILAEQTGSRWTTIYPLYSSRKSLAVLQGMAAGDSGAGTNGWSAFRSRPPRMDRGMFGAVPNAENDLVTVKIANQDMETVSLALARYAQAQVIPEDGTSTRVNLTLTEAPMSRAVAQLAVMTDRSWTRFYTLQPGLRFGAGRRGPPQEDLPAVSDTEPSPEGRTNPVFAERNRPEPSLEDQIRREQQYQALLETMSPEERQQAEQQRQRWREMRTLTPEQRRARFAQMAADPSFQQRIQQRALQRLLNSTPDQRVARDQRAVARLTGHTPPPPASAPPSGNPPDGQPPPARP